MTMTFIGSENLDVVHPGRLTQLSRQKWQPTAAPLVVWEPGSAHAYLLSPSEAAALLHRARRGESIDAILASSQKLPVIGSGTRPIKAAFVVEAGQPAGAWLPDELARARPRAKVRRGIASRSVPPVLRGRNRARPAAVPAGDSAIRRTPHLDAPNEIATAKGSAFTVAVRTDSLPLAAEEEGTDVVIEAPADVRGVDVGVLLLVSEHFVVEGPEYQLLGIDRQRQASDPVEFRLRVVEDPPERPAGVQALFLYHGRSCGQVAREWDWHNDAPTAQAAAPRGDAPTSMPVHVDAETPDLSIFITAPVNDGVHFNCAIETPLLPDYREARGGEFGLSERADTWVKNKLGRLTDERLGQPQRREALEEIGQQLFEAAPRMFQDVLWQLIDEGHPLKSIYIASVEPTLPWELMIPNRPPDKQPDVLKPLGVEFAVGRWTRGDSKSPPQMMPVRDSLVVAPDYNGGHELDARKEIALITERLNGAELKPATREQLRIRCRQAPVSLLHLVCHGEADYEEEDAVVLDNGEILTSGQVRIDSELRGWCTERAPFIFINACEAGQLVRSIGGGAGFPLAFATIGARAIIAPLWPVDDELAGEVAEELYTKALQDDAPPLAEILRQIRERAYTQLDADTFAAYCFYGDPLAKLRLDPAGGS